MASSSSTQKTHITVSGGGSTKGKAKKGGKQGGGGAAVAGKKPGRGMGVAQLERIRVQESLKMINELNPVPLQSGFSVPVRCGEAYAGPVPGPVPGPAPNGYLAPAGPGFLHGTPVGSVRIFRPDPPIPDPASWTHFDFSNLTFKKKRVMNGEDFEHRCYQGVEILAVHRKGVGTRNMVMEYGFFPASSSRPASTLPPSASASASVCPSNSSIDLSLKL